LIDIIPGGTLVTVGPQAIQQFKDGDWLGGLWTTMTIVLDESATFIPSIKVWNVGISIAQKSKQIKKVYRALKEAKQLGEEYVVKLYTVLKNRFGIANIKDKFKWLGSSDGAKLEGVTSADFFDDLKQAFGATKMHFKDFNSKDVFKIINNIPNTNLSVYMVLYPDSGTSWNFTIAFYTGPSNANAFSELFPTYKIRIDQ